MTSIDFSLPCLVIDTTTDILSLGIHVHEQWYRIYKKLGTAQSEEILPSIRQLLSEANINITQIAVIIYAQGPGMFTALRIGVGVAQGLALPHNIPLIGIPTLDAVAIQCMGKSYVLSAIDARMGEVFCAWYNTQNTLMPLGEVSVISPHNIRLPENITPQQVIGIGNAFALDIMPFSGSPSMPSVEHYLMLAKSGVYPILSAMTANLYYVRNKVALTSAEQQIMRKGKV